MPKPRRARSSLYQVDFIAALFGAFLLLWISKPTGSMSEPETAVVILESSCDDSDRISILPKLGGAARCVDKDLLQLTDPSLNLEACTFKPADSSKSAVSDPFRWDEKGPIAAFARLELFSKATGRGALVKFSGLAIVAADTPEHRFRAVGYGSSTPPDQVRGTSWIGWAAANVCQHGSCPLHYEQFVSALKQQCTIHLYSRAWPTTCLTTTVETGNPDSPFDLKPCGS
jgi:hypothetical protein